MPTASALDLADFNQSSFNGKFINGVASVSSSRTDAFIAQEGFTDGPSTYYNQFHTVFSARNSEWMFDVMEHKPFASSYCSAECSAPPAISSTLPAGQRLCAGQSATFSLPSLPAGTAVTWSATPTSFFTTTSGTGSTFTTTAANTSGTGTVTATVGPCNTSVSVSVPVGAGEATGRYVVGGYFSGSGTPLQTNNPAGPDKVNIIVDAPYDFTFTTTAAVSVSKTGNNSASFYMPSSGAGVPITATATNAACGVVGHWNFIPRPYRMMASPNPANTELTVTRVDANGQPASPDDTFDADLYDTFGRKVKTKKSSQGKAVLDVRALPDGLYNLRVGQGKDALQDHIQITH